MHPCLHIDEVVENIASHVEDRRTLMRLALVCRAFVEPATVALWAHLNGLEPLLMCLPSDLLGPSTASYGVLTITASPTQADWARFRHYARKVRSLQIRPADLRKLLDGAGHTILAEHHPTGVLPNLQRLRWHEWGSTTLALPFMQPTLSSLAYMSNTVQARRSVMEHVRTNLPQLKEFTCSHDTLYLPPADSLANEFSDTILTLNNLSTFLDTTTTLRLDAVLHLSKIPHLTALTVILANTNRDLWTDAHSGGFPALTHLTLSVCPMDDGLLPGLHMLRTLSGLALTTLEVNMSLLSIRAAEYADLIAAIGRFRCLRDCTIMGSRLGGEPAYAARTVDAGALTPLHALSDMRRFIQRSIPVAVQPESALQLVIAWPRLEDLALRVHSGGRTSYRELHRNDLLVLAQSGPGAEALAGMPRSVRDNEAHNISAVEHAPSNSNPVDPERSNSPLRAIDGVAAYLARMFPTARIEDEWVEVERPGAE